MSDFRVFSLRDTGEDVMVNLECVCMVGADFDDKYQSQAVFYMVDSKQVALSDSLDFVIARIEHGDDSVEASRAELRDQRRGGGG